MNLLKTISRQAMPVLFLLFGCLLLVGHLQAHEPLVVPFLKNGKLDQGKQKLVRHLDANPDDAQARFGLGVLHFVGAIDHLGKSWYRHGLTDRGLNSIPFLRIPVESNPAPETIDYQKFRAVFQEVIDRLEAADQELAKIEDQSVKLPIQIFNVRLDFDNDGHVGEKENLSRVIGRLLGARSAKDTVVAFDYADVQWLRGYTRLLRAICEFGLAYDQQELWDVTAHRLFAGADARYQFQEEDRDGWDDENRQRGFFGDTNEILDLIAGIHNLRFKLKEPQRLKKVHGHLKAAVQHSRQMWKSIEAEVDNDREWIPNTKQTSSVTQVRINPDMIKTWGTFLDEVSDILDGKKLLPFWRGTSKDRGINLKRFFLEPRDFDIVLWVHGSAATPYLEKGQVTNEADWRDFQQVFNGQLFGFAAWFN
jgi:hypothetical protein